MTNRTVLVGVDSTPDAAHAAHIGEWIATRLGAACRLIHGMSQSWTTVPPPDAGMASVAALTRDSLDSARTLIQASLEAAVSPAVLSSLEVEPGPGGAVLATAIRRYQAEVAVVGGKHHPGWERLLGSTVTDLLRLTDVPVLVTKRSSNGIKRILVAADLSYAAGPTILAAQNWARLFGASMRLLHVAEAMPTPGQSMPRDAEVYRAASERVQAELFPYLTLSGTSVVIRPGRSAAVIATEAAQWNADLLVVGSHGKGFIDRLLLGSTSERLVRMLVVPTLVIPTARGESAPYVVRMADASAVA